MTLRSGQRLSVPVTQGYHKKMKLFLRLALHDIHKTAEVFTVGQRLTGPLITIRVHAAWKFWFLTVTNLTRTLRFLNITRSMYQSKCSHLLEYFLTTV